MTLPTSGVLRASAIQTEFGGANPISIDEYYKGGANVPNTSTNAAIPTSGLIKFSEFYGGSKTIPASTLTAATVSYSGISVFGAAGYVNGAFDSGEAGGSLSPAIMDTYSVIRLIAGTIGSQPTLILTTNAPTITSITSISFIDSHSVSRTFTMSSASFSSSGGGATEWRWNTTYLVYVTGNTYTITVV